MSMLETNRCDHCGGPYEPDDHVCTRDDGAIDVRHLCDVHAARFILGGGFADVNFPLTLYNAIANCGECDYGIDGGLDWESADPDDLFDNAVDAAYHKGYQGGRDAALHSGVRIAHSSLADWKPGRHINGCACQNCRTVRLLLANMAGAYWRDGVRISVQCWCAEHDQRFPFGEQCPDCGICGAIDSCPGFGTNYCQRPVIPGADRCPEHQE